MNLYQPNIEIQLPVHVSKTLLLSANVTAKIYINHCRLSCIGKYSKALVVRYGSVKFYSASINLWNIITNQKDRPTVLRYTYELARLQASEHGHSGQLIDCELTD